MRAFHSTITSKGQVTIPVEIRRHLGVSPRDGLTFIVEEGENVVIVPASHDIMALAGAAGKLRRPLIWSDVRETAYEDAAIP